MLQETSDLLLQSCLYSDLVKRWWYEEDEIIVSFIDGENLSFPDETSLKFYLNGLLKGSDLTKMLRK